MIREAWPRMVARKFETTGPVVELVGMVMIHLYAALRLLLLLLLAPRTDYSPAIVRCQTHSDR